MKITLENLESLPIGEYAIFVDGKFTDSINSDEYSKKSNSFWDFYQEYGTRKSREIAEKYEGKNATIYPLSSIIEPETVYCRECGSEHEAPECICYDN